MHVLLTISALFAVILQMTFRVPGGRALSIIPLLNPILIGLHGLLIMKAILWRGRRRDLVPAVLIRVERASAAAVLGVFGYGLFLLANATLSSSMPYYGAAEVVAISGSEADFWGVLPYAWADLRSRATGHVERILLKPHERRGLWGGQPVELQLRRGRFNVPWITHIGPDTERQNQAMLRVTPNAALALYRLTHFYLARMRWDEGTATAIAYVNQYPGNGSVARHFAEILDAADRFPDVVAVLERVRGEDYEVSVLLGRALARVGRPADGVTLLEGAITLQPAEPGAYRELGMIHLATGNTAGAIRLFEKVLQLQPRSPDVQAELRRLRAARPA